MNTVIISMCAFAIYLLYLYYFKLTDKSNLLHVMEFYALTVGMHKNELADFFLLGFPIILGRFFSKKDFFSIVGICLTVVAVGFTFSRTAYVTLLLSVLFFLFISRRTKWLPCVIALAVRLSCFATQSIIDRASKGFESLDYDEISSGRIQGIWLPLVEEIIHNPIQLLFGNGRYAIVASKASANDYILRRNADPHNMYLEQILDVGILGLLILACFLGMFLKKAYATLQNIFDLRLIEYQYALFIAIVVFLISGIVGNTFFPTAANSYFWILLSCQTIMIHIASEHSPNFPTTT